MARLILEENGERRAFKLREGKLSIGSADACALTLASPDVAEVHAELELRGDVATLIPRPGVTPPKVLGRPISQPTRLPKSAEFRIGSAVFRLQPEGGAQAPAAPARASRGAAPAERRPRIERQRRNVQRGIPTWMVLGIIGVIAVVGFFVGRMWLEDREPEHDPRSRYLAALDAFNNSALDKALVELDKVDLERADPVLEGEVEALRQRVADRQEAAEVAAWNLMGTKEMETQLKGYERKYLKGNDVTRAKARLFVRRCDDFKRRYPKHPELGWVDRFRDRWAAKANLADSNDLEDITWEIKMLTGGKPRDYIKVFSLIDDFLERAEGADRDAALAMYDTQSAEREEYFTDRMQQSRWHWERKEYGQAVEWLVQVITKIGDPAMQEQATDALLKMTNQEGAALTDLYLGGYQRDRPWQFELLMEDPRLAARARAAGLL